MHGARAGGSGGGGEVVWTAQWHEGRAAAAAGYQDAVPAVLYLQQLEAAALGRHGDAHRAGVEAVLQVRVRVRLG